jgi:hypothetical protein
LNPQRFAALAIEATQGSPLRGLIARHDKIRSSQITG